MVDWKCHKLNIADRIEIEPKRERTVLLLAGRLSVFYLIFSVIVYIICPYQWDTKKPILFFSLLIFYIFALWFGFRLGVISKHFTANTWQESHMTRMTSLLGPLMGIYLVFYITLIFRSYALPQFDLFELIKRMSIGLKNPGLGYLKFDALQQGLSGSDVVGGKLFTYLNLLWSFAAYPVLLLSIDNFKSVKLPTKILVVSYCIISMLYYISRGTTIQAAYLAVMLCLPVIMDTLTIWYYGNVTAKSIIKFVSIILIAVILVVGYFGWMLQSRHAANFSSASEYEIGGYSPVTSENKPIEDNIPDNVADTSDRVEIETEANSEENVTKKEAGKLEQLWISFSSYLSQGYYGMSLALTVDWTPTFGLGSSRFVRDMVTEHLFDIDQYTYQAKLEPLGWEDNLRWHSMYTWIANDVSFYGVILVMLVIGMVFGSMFADAVIHKNPLARISMFYWALMILFIPCNNQIGQSSDLLLSFIPLCLLWGSQKIVTIFHERKEK